MSIIDKLASSLNRRDEVPNQELAKQITVSKDKQAVRELVENLTNKDRAIQNDCIKVLYEIGYEQPALIAEYFEEFVALLNSKNNRLQWGGMIALSTITKENPEAIYANLSEIIDVADKGSVITKDGAVNILIELCTFKQYAENAFSLLIEQLLKSAVNQLPMYSERVMPIINNENKELFIRVLNSRLNEIDKDSKKKRVEKVIKKLT